MEPSPKENQESEKEEEESSLRELGRPDFSSHCGLASNLGEYIEVYFFFLDVFWICSLVAAPALVGIAAAIDYPMELVVAGSFYVILALQTWIAASKLGSFGAPVALLYPLPLLVFLYVAARVIVFAITGRKIQWKGRAVSPRATKS